MSKIELVWKLITGYKIKMVIILMLYFLFAALNLLPPLIFGFIIDNVIGNDPITNSILLQIVELIGGLKFLRGNLWIGGLVIIVTYVLTGYVAYFRRKMIAEVSEGVTKKYRDMIYSHLQSLPYSYHVKAKIGDLIQRCTNDVNLLRRMLNGQIGDFLYAIITAVMGFSVLYGIYPRLAFISIICIPIIFVLAFMFFKFIHRQFKKVDEADGKMSDAIQSTLNNSRVIKAFNREEYELKKCEKEMLSFKKLYTRIISLNGAYWGLSDALCLSQTCIVVAYGIFDARAGFITIGDFFVFLSYVSMIIWPMRQVGRILSDMGRVSVGLGRVLEILNEKIEDCESGLTPEINGEIEFNDVCFKYDDGNENVLDNLSFRIKKGQTVAIMGPTGSGKSSLVHLLTRLYDYSSGSIKIDGIELKNIQKKHLRNNVGIVLQEPYLFSKSIYDNIKIAKPEADINEIQQAAQIASIDEVIKEFDKGYDTLVGEKGVTLSGGQKQRVAIARTIINKNPIVIFDDSLSAVDTETDANIRKALKSISSQTTTIIITHRCTSAMNADMIIVLDEGKIIQSGNHQQLIKEDGLYKRIFDIQSQIMEVI